RRRGVRVRAARLLIATTVREVWAGHWPAGIRESGVVTAAAAHLAAAAEHRAGCHRFVTAMR
ncbi:hypothetical protein, partial [Xanthomonas oryzae]|uniref:hypothetical protein n=1 Tax=Xanthomonas oryzae TaxID=347 RepID=UPI001C4A75C9